MGEIDLLAHKFFEICPQSFAELFNKLLFHEEVIDYRKMQSLDSKYVTKYLKEHNGFFRDEIRFAEFKTAGAYHCILLGIECYSYIDYKAPVKAMIYDGLSYERQLNEIYAQATEQRPPSGDEYLSKFPKGGYLVPVFTLVLNLKPKKWDGPKSLKEMIQPDLVKRFGKYLNDYRNNLIEASEIDDEVLNYFSNDTRGLLGYIKYSDDDKKLDQFIHSVPEKTRLEPITAELINATTNANIDQESCRTEDGGVDMCKAFDNLQTRAEKAEAVAIEAQAVAKAKTVEIDRLRVMLKERGCSDEEIDEGFRKGSSSGLVF